MFDIGFSEMFVIAVIALVVLGPEKLPRVARTAGHLLGRMQRYVNDVKADIHREVELDELRKLQKEMQNTANSIEQSVKGQFDSVQTEFKQIGDSTQKALSDPLGLQSGDPSATQASDPVADAFADPPPVQSPAVQLPPLTEPPMEVPVAPRVETAQLKLDLDDTLPRFNAPPPAALVSSPPPPAVAPATTKA